METEQQGDWKAGTGILRVPEGITVLPDYALAERRELEEVFLPDSLREIGRHAFYNCRSLCRISFADTLKEIGDGAFKNCEQLHELRIRNGGTGTSAGLKGILTEQDESFLVRFSEHGSERQEEWAVFFPAYRHDYEENTQARIINQVTYGIGVHYRECVREGELDYAAYDGVFSICVRLDKEAAQNVAFLRCVYPHLLRPEAEAAYLVFLREHRREMLARFAKESDPEPIRKLAALPVFEREEDWNEAIDLAHEMENWEAVSFLMQERQVRYGGKRKKYEF